MLTRVGGLFVLAPIFSARALPAQAKVVVASALALALTPLASRGQAIPADAAGITVLVVKEAIVGLAFAFALSAIVAAVQTAAGLIDTMSGFSYASLDRPVHEHPGRRLRAALLAVRRGRARRRPAATRS